MREVGRTLLRASSSPLVLLSILSSWNAAVAMDMSGVPPLCTDPVCYYEWDIRWDRSMTHREGRNSYNVILNETDTSLRITHNLFREDDPLIGTPVNKHQTLTADAYPRDMIVINRKFPGPTLNIMEGSQVEVRVTNNLGSNDLAIHFLGPKLLASTFYDGTPYVSQCPIHATQTFTYKFTATPAGTHYYYGNYQSQRADGLFGMMIVHRRVPHLPDMLMLVSDWWHVGGRQRQTGNPYEWDWPGTGEYETKVHESHATIVYGTQSENVDPKIRPLFSNIDESNRESGAVRPPIGKQLDIPAEADTIEYVHRKDAYNPYTPFGSSYKNSFVLNGRGRGDGNTYPLHRYFVDHGQTYRFRAAHVGSQPGIRVSIDQHQLRVVAADGANVDPHTVDMVFMGPGDRFDFEVDMTATPGRYWVRVWVHEHYEESPSELGRLGILTYFPHDDDKEDPTSAPAECTSSHMCSALNCMPYSLAAFYTTCIDLQDVHVVAGHEANYYMPSAEDDYDEYFLNLAMLDGPTINGVKYKEPTLVPSFGGQSYTPCNEDVCSQAPCHCTNTLTFEGNKTIQLVISNYDTSQGSTPFGHHSVHLHGHSFYVLKQGYPVYDKSVMTVLLANTDIDCGNELCKDAKWRHEPEYNYNRPARKDSVTIPTMGYVVVRFKADNPGLWMLSSQVMIDQRSGMQLMTIVSSPTEGYTIDQIPKCGNATFMVVPPEMEGEFVFDDPNVLMLAEEAAVECAVSVTSVDTSGNVVLSRAAFAFTIIGSLAIGVLVVVAAFYVLVREMPSKTPEGTANHTRTPLLRDYE